MATDNQGARALSMPETGAGRGASSAPPKHAESIGSRLWRALVWGAMGFFLLNVLLLIATVAVNSIGTRWFGTLLPQGFTLHWYAQAWSDFQLSAVLRVTVEVVGAVVLLSIALGVPAAYALARAQFPGKRYHVHNPALTAVRTDLDDLKKIADHVAGLVAEATGPVRFMVPLKGFSNHDSPAGHLHDPSLPPPFAHYLQSVLPAHAACDLHDHHFNDPEFADAIVAAAKAMAGKRAAA